MRHPCVSRLVHPLRALLVAFVCLSAADANCQTPTPPGIDTGALLPDGRGTLWNPGMAPVGGIPVRDKVCASLSPRGEGLDDTSQIQGAIATCPHGEVVQLSAGTFIINSGNFILLSKSITLRGAGPDKTTLAKTNGAKPFDEKASSKPSPLIVVGPAIYANTGENSGVSASTDLVADAVKGEYSVTVESTVGLSPGQIVLLDEASNASWQPDPVGRGKIWASPDYRVVWQKHDPPVQYVDDFTRDTYPTTPRSPGGWFSRLDRPTSEIKQVASISGSVVTFNTPIHISYRTGNKAQLSKFWRPHVTHAGVEDLKLFGGDSGNLRFQWAAFSWARNVDSTQWYGEGFAINGGFRVELREFYVHDAAWAQPGGGGYAISLAGGSSEVLIENGISVRANKLMVVRSSGAGSVFGYNYVDMGYINTQGYWHEIGLNASHMVGSHHVLFEGNYGYNADNDQTHGNSIYLTYFRNHLRGIRAPFDNQAGGRIDDANRPDFGPKRCAGLMAYSYWMSFVGNVMGAEGKMGGWVYETTFPGGKPGIWMLGWDGYKPFPTDAKVAATAIRHGNFDYLTKSVKWEPSLAARDLPPSFYLTKRPDFFDAGRGYAWPWVDPVGATKLHTLPAKARYDAGTPFVQP